MSLDIYQIAEAFCSHRFAETFPYMDDEIKWNMIGREGLIGREAVIAHCNKGVKFLETVSTTHLELKIFTARRLMSLWKALHDFKTRIIKIQA